MAEEELEQVEQEEPRLTFTDEEILDKWAEMTECLNNHFRTMLGVSSKHRCRTCDAARRRTRLGLRNPAGRAYP